MKKKKEFSDDEYWGRPAAGFGDEEANLVIVGLAPAAHGANRTGRVFTGDRTGDFLIAALHRTGYANRPASVSAGDGLELDGARLVSAVRCAPPQNRPTAWEQAMCAPWLDRELELVDPGAILALGGIGWQATIRALRRAGWNVPRPLPKFGHGEEFRALRRGKQIAVLGSYHPSQHNTFTGRLTEVMLDEVLHRTRRYVKGESDY